MKGKKQAQSRFDFSPEEATDRLFVAGLLQWNDEDNDRQMPWKGEKDPYRIWLSEVILQQTRVEQGLKYYENFISTFPDVSSLAAAPDGGRPLRAWRWASITARTQSTSPPSRTRGSRPISRPR